MILNLEMENFHKILYKLRERLFSLSKGDLLIVQCVYLRISNQYSHLFSSDC